MAYKAILATGIKGELGLDNKLLFHIAEDLKNFKKLTDNQVVVMGRKTHDSIKAITKLPQGLPNRHNYVLSRTGKGLQEGGKYCIINNVDALDDVARHRDVWVIGGAEVYKLYLDKVGEIYHTEVDQSFHEADTHFDMSFVKDTKVWEKVSTTRLTDIAQVVYYRRVD